MILNGSLQKISPFRGAQHFFGPKKSRAPQKVSILCRDHLEFLKWPHKVILKGWFPNIPPHFQYRDINSYTFINAVHFWISQLLCSQSTNSPMFCFSQSPSSSRPSYPVGSWPPQPQKPRRGAPTLAWGSGKLVYSCSRVTKIMHILYCA